MRPACLGLPVRHMDDRNPFLVGKPREKVRELVTAFGVHHGGGLVGNQQPWSSRECGRDGQPL